MDGFKGWWGKQSRRTQIVLIVVAVVVGLAAIGALGGGDDAPEGASPPLAAADDGSAADEEDADDGENSFTARVSGLPRQQLRGLEYEVQITVENNGGSIDDFCIDFDEQGAWLIEMTGMTDYANDTFCTTLPPGESSFTASLTPAEAGARKLSILLGEADITNGEAFITDDAALGWEEEFVIL